MTIRDLKKLLEYYPDDTEIMAVGVDSGGYDAKDYTNIRIFYDLDKHSFILEGFESETNQ